MFLSTLHILFIIIEQHYNAAALQQLGVPVLRNLKSHSLPDLHRWITNPQKIQIDFSDQIEDIISNIFSRAFQQNLRDTGWKRSYYLLSEHFRERIAFRKRAA